MLGRQEGTVRVTSRADLEAALKTADRIVVEGDALADYAVSRVQGPAVAAPAAAVRPIAPLDMEAHVAAVRAAPRLWPWVLGAVLLALAAGAAFVIEHVPMPMAHGPDLRPAAPTAAAPLDLARLAWPVVAVVAILALFFIVRGAIASGRNVQISWKVTEKVQGRVVITRTRRA